MKKRFTITGLVTITILLFSYANINAQSVSKLDTVIDTKAHPFQSICYQYITRKKTLWRTYNKSTGFLIKRNIILTAAHNIHSNSLSKVEEIVILLARNKNHLPFDSIRIKISQLPKSNLFVHPSYRFTDRNRIKYDFGIIVIPDSILNQHPNWPRESDFELDENYQLKQNDKIYVAGYPASHGYNGSLMTYQNQNVTTIFDRSFQHDLNTRTGNSGSPIWILKDGKQIVVGVHTFKKGGTKLNKADINLISDWINNMELYNRN